MITWPAVSAAGPPKRRGRRSSGATVTVLLHVRIVIGRPYDLTSAICQAAVLAVPLRVHGEMTAD